MAGIGLGVSRGRGGFVHVSVFGEREVIDNLTNYSRRKYQGLTNIINETGENILRNARARVNVDSGKLRGSLKADVSISNFNFKVEVGSDLFYAKYVEFGTGIYSSKGSGRKSPWIYYAGGRWWWTKGARPRPYLTPAYDAEKDNFISSIKREMRAYM